MKYWKLPKNIQDNIRNYLEKTETYRKMAYTFIKSEILDGLIEERIITEKEAREDNIIICSRYKPEFRVFKTGFHPFKHSLPVWMKISQKNFVMSLKYTSPKGKAIMKKWKKLPLPKFSPIGAKEIFGAVPATNLFYNLPYMKTVDGKIVFLYDEHWADDSIWTEIGAELIETKEE